MSSISSTSSSTNKALQEAQGVLREIRDKCARAFQDTKRLEAEAKSVDLRRENLEREVHSTCAECASLEEDCLQQEAYLAEFPHRLQQSTVKSEEMLQQWSRLDRDATLVLDTASEVRRTKESRLAHAHSEFHSAKHKLHLLEVRKVKQISQVKLELETELQRKSQLEFQFANQKSTLACSEKVTLEAQQVLDDRRLVALALGAELEKAKAKDVVIPLARQEELHVLHMENETRALELAKQEHANRLAVDLLERAVEAGSHAHGQLETELAEARQRVDAAQVQVQAKHLEFALEEERLENELVGLEQEQDLLTRQAEEAQSEVAARIVRLRQDEQEQIQRERLVLEAELGTLALQEEVLERRSVDQARQMVELELARERKLAQDKQVELDLLEKETARVAKYEARKEKEAARAAKDEAKKAKQADRRQRELEAAEEAALLEASKAREKALVQEQRAEAAAKLEQQAAQHCSSGKKDGPLTPTKPQPLPRRGSSRAATQVPKPQSQQQRKAQPLPITAAARIQSTTPEWVRKQIAGTYKPSPVREEPSSSEEEEEEKAKPLARKTTATYSRKPTTTTTTHDNDSSGSQFDLFDE